MIKMANKITIGALTAIITSLVILGGVTLTDENVYYCSDRNIVMQCDKLSQYYSLDNGKCWNSEVGNKLCQSGWEKVEKDFEIVPEPRSSSKQCRCDNIKCVSI